MDQTKIRSNLAISDTGFIFDPTSGESFTLNQTGLEIIKLMKENKNIGEIKTAIIEKYEVDTASIDKTIYEFITFLNDYRLTESNV